MPLNITLTLTDFACQKKDKEKIIARCAPLALHWLLYAFNTTGNGLGIAKVR